MSCVFKYPLEIADWVCVTMPRGSQPISVQMQHGLLCLWAHVPDETATPVTHHFRIAGTGHDLGSNVGRHIGSVQMAGGDLVFHVFAEAGQ